MASSFLSFILLSFPESLLIGTISILTIGKFTFFKDDKRNIIRVLISAIISAALSLFFYGRVPDVERPLLYILITPLLFIFLLRLKLYESIIAPIFGLAIQLLTEVIWISLALPFIGSYIDKIYADIRLLFLFSLPTRLLQLLLIYLSYKFHIRIIDFQNSDVKKKEYYIQLIVYVLSIGTLIFLAFLLTKMVVFGNPNESSYIDGYLIRINIYLALFVIIILTLTIKSTTDYYRNKNRLNKNEYLQNIIYISNLINEDNIPEAKKAIDSLKEHLLINKNC